MTTSVVDPREADLVAPPASLPAELVEALARAGIDELYSHQVEALEAARRGNVIVTSGTASGKSLSFNLPVLDAIVRDSQDPRPLHLSDQGAGAGPGAKALRARPALASARDLRRRYAARGPTGDPAAGEPRLDQPRHAQHGGPRASQGLGRLLRQRRLGRRRRGAHLPRRFRLPRRQRPAPAATGRPRLRRRPAVHLRVGDDRQPGRARRAARRRPVRARRLRRRPACPAADRDVGPAGDRRTDDDPPIGAVRGCRSCSRTSC